MALKNRPARPMQAAASAFFSVALVAGLMPVLPAAAYAEEQAQPAAGVTAVQEVQTPSLLDEGGATTAPAAQSLLAESPVQLWMELKLPRLYAGNMPL